MELNYDTMKKALESHQYGPWNYRRLDILAVASECGVNPRAVLQAADFWGMKALIEPFRAGVERQIEEYEARARSVPTEEKVVSEQEPVGAFDSDGTEQDDEAKVRGPAPEPVPPVAETATAQDEQETVHEPAAFDVPKFSKKNPDVGVKTFYVTRENFDWLKQRAETVGCGVNELVHRALAEFRERRG